MILAILLLLSADVETLAANAGVRTVEQILPGEPAIIHLRNWHFVQREPFAANTGLVGAELEREYTAAMTAAANVHKSLKVILANEREVYQEALTEENSQLIAPEILSLAAYHKILRTEQLEDADHERTLLRLGAVAELLLDGKPIKLLPAEGAEYQAALVKAKDGVVDDKLNAAREAAIVKRLTKGKKDVLIVLGGDHDLTEYIKPTGWGYIRITPRGYPE